MPRFVKRANVAAGAKRAIACTSNDDISNFVVILPRIELRLHLEAHVMRQRVQRFRAIERDQAHGAAPFEQNFRIAHCRDISRAMITRMISLVPSRI